MNGRSVFYHDGYRDGADHAVMSLPDDHPMCDVNRQDYQSGYSDAMKEFVRVNTQLRSLNASRAKLEQGTPLWWELTAAIVTIIEQEKKERKDRKC